MIKVRALNTYEEKHIIDGELKIIPREGYEFEVSEERYKELTRDNEYKLKFVEKVKKEKLTENQDVQGSE